MADSDDDVPPLEDMSEMLKQVDAIRDRNPPISEPSGQKHLSNGTHKQMSPSPGTKASTDQSDANQGIKDKPIQVHKEAVKQATFGGMKKGFLFGPSPKAAPKQTVAQKVSRSEKDEIPLIKPKDPSSEENQHKIQEVQQAMDASQAFLQNKEWVNDDLLGKVEKNETLMKQMADPRFMQAIAEFQTNPTGAMAKYQSNPEIQNFLMEFCGILGSHFTKLGEQSQPSGPQTPSIITQSSGAGADMSVRSSSDPKQPTAADHQKMSEILEDPDVKNILMDPQIQTLITSLRSNPDDAQRLLRSEDRSFQSKLKKLVDVGLLQIQR